MELLEIVCDKCLQPILQPGPLHEVDSSYQDVPFYTICGHVYHYNCVHGMHTDSTELKENMKVVACTHQGCMVKFCANQFSRIEFTTRPRPISGKSENPEVRDLIDQLNYANNVAHKLQQKCKQLSEELSTLRRLTVPVTQPPPFVQIRNALAPRPSFLPMAGPPPAAPRPSFLPMAGPPPAAPRTSFLPMAKPPPAAPRTSFLDMARPPPAIMPRPTTTMTPFCMGNADQSRVSMGGQGASQQTARQELPQQVQQQIPGAKAPGSPVAHASTIMMQKHLNTSAPNVKTSCSQNDSNDNDILMVDLTRDSGDTGLQKSTLVKGDKKRNDILLVDLTYDSGNTGLPKNTQSAKGDKKRAHSPHHPTYPDTKHPAYGHKLTSPPYDDADTNCKRLSVSYNSRLCGNKNLGNQKGKVPPKAKNPPQPQVKKRGTCAEVGKYHKRYLQRFGTDSSELRPWYPANSYPYYFTVAARERSENVFDIVVFAYNILIIGDGHAHALAKYIVHGKNFQNSLDDNIYRLDMSIVDLIEVLRGLSRIPERIMISIGNFDIVQRMHHAVFYNHMIELAHLLRTRNVKEVYFLPLIPCLDQNKEHFEAISSTFQHDWGIPSNAKYVLATKPFEELSAFHPQLDELGPYYLSAQYENVVTRLRELYVPIPPNLRAKLDLPQPPLEAVPNKF